MINRKRRRFLSLLLGSSVLPACKDSEIRRSIEASEKIFNGDISGVIDSEVPSTGVEAVDQIIRSQVEQLLNRLSKYWGDKKISTSKEVVKYSDKYQTRAIINFSDGYVRVETVADQLPEQKLKSAIINTLLTPDDPRKVDILSDDAVKLGGTPFLFELVHDQDNKPVETKWRANRYAEYLLSNNYTKDLYKNKQRRAVNFEMVKEYQSNQQNKFSADVAKQSRRFSLDQSLVYAIIETESAFNPYAMSHIPAYGLMQIVPVSAGRDAYEFIHNKPGTPSRDYLFVPANNIEMGCVYLHILNTRYLSEVSNPLSREYCVIAGYNTGSGNVLKAFDKDRTAAYKKINQLTPDQVYQHLRKNLSYEEARNYLYKVTTKKANYS